MDYNYTTTVELKGEEIKALRKAVACKQVELEDFGLKDSELYATLEQVYNKLILASLYK